MVASVHQGLAYHRDGPHQGMWIASLSSVFTQVERDTVGDLALQDGLVRVTRLQQGKGTGPTKYPLCRDDVSGGETEFP